MLYGLHAGALNYVASYGSVESNDRIVIVKINPADVVSVPSDCNCEKLRTCRYEVVGEYQGELLKPLTRASLVKMITMRTKVVCMMNTMRTTGISMMMMKIMIMTMNIDSL